jgi:hypothetical protein
MNDFLNELANAKTRRGEAAAALKVAAESVVRDDDEVAACKAHVDELAETRAGYIASAKPVAVLAIDERLLKGRIGVEVAAARAATSAARHAAAVAELHAAKAAVDECAQQVLLQVEMVDLAVEITALLDRAFPLGERLQALAMRDALRRPMNVSVPTLPREVESALARLPQADQMHVPVDILRNGVNSRVWSQRVAELAG